MSLRIPESQFNIKDLTLDVRLDAIIDGTPKDFTGKKIFSVDFFRKNIGFGITDVEIEVNTSLQPIITITFKDLYGNTVFGKTKSSNPELAEIDENDIDFSVLFNWPPPKFLFTFKGFLGKSATWMLNMKKSSISYDSSDGSYNIKCDFVPNQWGFLSDLPFLYLLAVKALKKQTMDEAQFTKVQTIFDLIKIGKQVEVKTQETTKEFDNVMKQMTLLKSQRVYDALNISKVINYDEAITGQVGNQSISPFNAVTIIGPSLVPQNSDIDSPEKVKALALNATNLRRINTFFLLTAQIGATNPEKITFNDVLVTGGANGTISVPKVANFEQNIAARINLISSNIANIENAIKLKTYNSSKSQLEKVTIGEIFKQLAEDSGYIMGRILEAGYQGYSDPKFTETRNSLRGTLIGRSFPLILTSDKKEEKPAIKQYGFDVGADEHELAFVDNFINAISEGIATELLAESEATQNVGDNLIKKRINNLEALKSNPYKPFFQNIAENIMVRGAIVAYLTRSPDPNKPGDYDTFFGADRATNAEDVIALADSELENITDSIIGNLTDSDFKSLKTFCTFWDNFLTEDCENLQEPATSGDKKGSLVKGATLDSSYLSLPGNPLPNSLLDYTVLIQKPAEWDGTYAGQSGLETTTLRNVMQGVFRPKPVGSSSSVDATNSNFVDLNSLQAIKLINNGIAYFKPSDVASSVFKTSYVYVMFSGPDANKTQQVMSADSDSEIKNDSEAQKDETKPLGFVNIQNPIKEGKLLPVVEGMNKDRIPNKLLLDYSRLTNPNNEFFQLPNTLTLSGENYFTVNNVLGNPDNLASGEIPAKNITLSVAYHPNNTELIFGPFVLNAPDSIVHRGWIKRMCVKLKEKVDGVEQKRNQIISDVLGKSSEQRDLLYKQMHVLYQQWEVLIIKDSDSAQKQNTDASSPGAISNEMNERYSAHLNYNMAESVANEAADNTFLYGYPLNSTTKAQSNSNINVKNSIINIESLYKPNGNTTVLNIIQQICTKNNFIFIPMPGEPGVFSTSEIFSPHPTETPKVKNFFYVQFVPTPESRATLRSDDNTPLSSSEHIKDNLPEGTLQIKFGSTDNQIVKNISVDTQESKTTAESIVNLQRLVDNENQNKTVTTDCSMLPVLEGRSYRATADMLGNAQVFPMQFFFLDSNPLFNGLYQIMKVKHSIRPNDMTTSAEGIRMRMDYQTGDFGGIPPITLETLSNLSAQTQLATSPSANLTADDFKRAVADTGVNSEQGVATGTPDATPNTTVSTSGVILLPNIRGVRNSIRLTQSTNPAISPIGDTNSEYTKEVNIKNLNQFISDVLEPFAAFLKQNYPELYKNWQITSAQRGYVPPGGAGGKGNQNISQHQKGQAIDSQIVGGKTTQETMTSNLKLLNAILEWHALNPSILYDQILWETRAPGSSWIHWSYHRTPSGRAQLLRFVNDKKYIAKINGFGRITPVTADEVVLKIA